MRTRDQIRNNIDIEIDHDRVKLVTSDEMILTMLIKINKNLEAIKRNTARIP